MPYFSILSIVYRFIDCINIVNLIAFGIGKAVAAMMVALKLAETLVHLMLGGTPGIVRYAQSTTGIDEALTEYPQH